MDRRRFFINKNLNENLSSYQKNKSIEEDVFAELDTLYEDLSTHLVDETDSEINEKSLQIELDEGIFDSKETKEKQYAEAIVEKTKKNVQTLGTDVAKEISTAMVELASELTDYRDDRGASDKVASEIYHFAEELESKYTKKKEDGKFANTAIIWDVIDFLNGYKARAKCVNEHVKTLKTLDDFIGSINEIPKIGTKALAYAKLIINKTVVNRLEATKNTLKKEYRIKA